MLYTKENYPSIMEDLPEKVRKKAISLTNEMIHDNNVRYHEDFIIIMAMERAKQWAEIQN